MPLSIAEDSSDSTALMKASQRFIIFYSSVVDGQLWCPDCRDVEQVVQDTFSGSESSAALIVYVGNRNEWKSPSNIYRAQPWSVQSIPTIVKLKDGKEEDRLVLDEIKDTEKRKKFIA
ncbi:hypothetical protein F5887DRAFT_68493 [Amanita rubescens]|nr:hypothetical protein F5887DRAFT_68493 [Amanita rubescens]